MATVFGTWYDPERNVRFTLLNRCFPHVINIATQTILKELKENPMQPIRTNLEGALAPPSEHAEHEATEQYVQALVADPVGKARNIVAACRKSGQRRSDLMTVIENGNNDESWNMRRLQLLRDCETRWSSTYLMNDRVLDLYPVCHYLHTDWSATDLYVRLLHGSFSSRSRLSLFISCSTRRNTKFSTTFKQCSGFHMPLKSYCLRKRHRHCQWHFQLMK